jgi:hypothetical protein
MRLANGLTVVEIVRPDRDTVKRGYGRVWLTFDDGSGFNYYPSDILRLDPDDDQPLDRTMDDWPGRWWPIDGAESFVTHPGAL